MLPNGVTGGAKMCSILRNGTTNPNNSSSALPVTRPAAEMTAGSFG